jgi:hypothetical protein
MCIIFFLYAIYTSYHIYPPTRNLDAKTRGKMLRSIYAHVVPV